MKRGLFGCLLLIVLLSAGLTELKATRQLLKPIVSHAELASQTVLQGDFEKTAALTEKARAAWEKTRGRFSFLNEQEAVREIDRLYDEAEVFLRSGEKIHCSAAFASLKNQLQALLEDQQLSLPNLL